MTVSDSDVRWLHRCVELARTAAGNGDAPFGSVLVDGDGKVLREDRNRTGDGDRTRHPEFALARWAAENLSPGERRAATVYTSGEHCPMCAAAHAWVGLGRIVYATSAEQIRQWRSEVGLPEAPVAALPIKTVAPGIVAEGPVAGFADELRVLYQAQPC